MWLIAKSAARCTDFRRAGFVFHEEHNKLQANVTPPEGWRQKGDQFVDAQGRVRTDIEYCWKLWDSYESASMLTRYYISSGVQDRVTGKILFHGSYAESVDWLGRNYPDHEDPLAYWDE